MGRKIEIMRKSDREAKESEQTGNEKGKVVVRAGGEETGGAAESRRAAQADSWQPPDLPRVVPGERSLPGFISGQGRDWSVPTGGSPTSFEWALSSSQDSGTRRAKEGKPI